MSDCLSSPRGHSGHFAKFHMLKFTKVYFLHSFHLISINLFMGSMIIREGYKLLRLLGPSAKI